ncbi:hypothetical protein [Zhongshania sp.]|uniref:hypothetical protein n=1 Tax=Zhongshania sp. TaxID=1971902 RepID=UPI00356195FF
MSDEQQILEEAMYAAETGNANHWPIVASILANEITRLRAQLAEVEEGQEPVGYGYFHKETGRMDGWLDIGEAEAEGHAWPDTHEPRLIYTHPAPAKVPAANSIVEVDRRSDFTVAVILRSFRAATVFERWLKSQGGE